MDIVNLGFSVDTTQLKNAERDLDGVAGGAKRLSRAWAVVAGIATGATVTKYARAADQWSDFSSRVGLAIGDMEKAPEVMQRLGEMADRSFSRLDTTTEGWLQNVGTLKELGLSIGQSLDFVEAFNNAMVVSGTKGDRADRVMYALNKAMIQGKLSGDQLRTVMTDGGRAAELIAEHMGVAKNDLWEMGKAGEITADVIDAALRGNLEKLREEADAMPATIEDGFQRIGNAVDQIIGTFDQATGASEALAGGLVKVSEGMTALLRGANEADGIATQWAATFDRLKAIMAGLGDGDTEAGRAAFRDFIADAQDGANRLIGAVPQLETTVARLRTALDAAADRDWQLAGIMIADFLADAADGVDRLMDMAFGEGTANQVRDWLDSIVAYLGSLPGRVRQWGADVVAAASESLSGLYQAGVDAVTKLWDGMRAKMGELKAWVSQQLADIAKTESSIRPGSLLDRGRNWFKGGQEIGAGLTAGMDSSTSAVARAGTGLANSAAKAVRDGLQIRSPSRIMAGYGEQAAAGLAVGIAANTDAPVSAMTSLAEQSLSAMDDFKASFADVVKSVIDGSKSLPEAIGDMLKSIADKLLSSGIDALIDGIFGGLFGGGGGDPLTSALLGAGMKRSYAGGGYTGNAPRFGGLDGKGGFLAMLHPRETVIDHARGEGGAATGSVHVHVTVGMDESGNLQVRRIAQQESAAMAATINRALPARVQQINRDPRARAG